MRKIFRYKNRKYYDTSVSQYLTCADIVRFDNAKVPLQVICHATKLDITAQTVFRARFYTQSRVVTV